MKSRSKGLTTLDASKVGEPHKVASSNFPKLSSRLCENFLLASLAVASSFPLLSLVSSDIEAPKVLDVQLGLPE